MAISDIAHRVRTILYGHGLGEKPVILQAAADAGETGFTNTKVISFNLTASGNVEAGDTLSVYDSDHTSPASGAHAFYVLSTTGVTVTAVNGYWGSPSAGDADLDGSLLELNPLRTEWAIFQAIETIFDSSLYPDVPKYTSRNIATPDMTYYQNEIPATVQEVLHVWQDYAGKKVPLPFELVKDVATGVSSTGNLLTIGVIDGSTAYVNTVEKYLSSDTIGEDLTQCVATGAAAILLGASISETNLEASSKSSQERNERNVSQQLWREFVTQRQLIADNIARRVDWMEIRR